MNTENPVKMDSRIVRMPAILFHELDGETVMVNLEKGEYYSLPPIGTRIWKMLESPQQVSDLCASLLLDFKVTPEQCAKDVLAFLNQMAEKGTIALVNE